MSFCNEKDYQYHAWHVLDLQDIHKPRKELCWEGPKSPNRSIIIQGAVSRLRPILLTTLTTVLGLLPTAYGLGGYDAFISPMCLALAWGLLIATLILLFLVPSHYSFWSIWYFLLVVRLVNIPLHNSMKLFIKLYLF